MKKSAKQLKKRSKTKPKAQGELSHIPNKLRKMIADDVVRYLGVIGMNQYKHRVMYKKPAARGSNNKDSSTVAAEAIVNRRYLTLEVRVHPWLVDEWKKKEMSDNDVHEIISHEVAHAATDHLYRIATATYKDEGETTDSWETLTTVVGRLICEVDNLRKTNKK